MRAFDVALKDLQQIGRDRKALLFLVLMPAVFTVFMGLASGRNSPADPRLSLGWRDNDGGLLSTQLRALLEGSDIVRLVTLDAAASPEQKVRDGQVAGAIVVPAGFSAQALAGTPPAVTLVADEATSNGQAAVEAARTALVRVLTAGEIARLSVDVRQPRPASEAERQAALEQAVTQAVAAWQNPPLGVTREKAQGAKPAGPAQSSNPYTQASPGMMVMFSIFGVATSATVLVQERKSKTLQRMLTTATRRSEIILGHALAMFVVVLAQEALLVVLGQAAFKVDYAREPLAVLLVAVGLALWIASLGLFIGVAAKSEEQATLWSLIAMFVFSALGGAWFSIEYTGKAFAFIGHLMPSAWAMDGFQNLIIRGQGLQSALLPAGLLLAYAAAFFGLAVWRFGKDEG